ncbi:15788_t:CDS:2, partial [Cetraspora pellucida]
VNLAKEYRISEQSVSDILKCFEYWLGLNNASTLIQVKCQKKPDNPELEENRAGIFLSIENLYNNFISIHEETKLEAFMSEEAELEAEIINLIECLPIEDLLYVQKYIEVDNYINIKENLTINKIVNIVNGQDESKLEQKQEEIVKISDAVLGLNNLIKYIQQNDLEITSSLIKDLHSLKKYIIYLHNESKRQTMLEEFINLIV